TLETNAEFARTPLVRLFRNLLGNDAYRKKFIDTFCLMGGSVFERQRVSTLVTELADAMRPMQQLEGRNPDGSANEIKQQLNGRLDVAINQLKEYKPAKLQGLTRMTVKLGSGTDGATLLVNGMEVPYASFNGYLYAPVTVEAKAPAGYTFAGWRKTVGSRTETLADAVISVTDASVSLTAIFESTSQQAGGSTSGQVNGSTSPVRINEVSAANNIYVNEFFRRNDWVELYNTTSQPVDVEGMYLSDNPDQPKKYQISKSQTQASTLIPPHGHLIVWCDKREPLSQLHAPFNLDADGGAVVLTAADESWSDRIAYSAMRGDETVCRYPDGANQVFIMNVPTIAKANIVTSYATFLGDDGQSGIDTPEMAGSGPFRIGFAHDCLTVRSAQPIEAAELAIYTVTGQLLARHTLSLADGYAEHPLGTLPAGSYVARLTDGYRHTAICKFIIHD
ncbi:MAG: lamin tail domain-containing protein, partial [Bacteroidaceae bacterium]|nr:lamin tail domain-containing protein [Bacteroidaceae bacterium]